MPKKSLIIGYETLGLKYVNEDIRLMSKAFENNGITFVTPEEDDNNSKKNILLKTLDLFFDSVNATDTIFFYFTGHALSLNGELVLVIEDDISKINSSTIKLSFITSYLENCRASKILLILDCCNALTGIIDWRPPQYEAIRILAASGQFEKAKEVEDFRSSFLTYNINRALTTNSSEILNKHNSININALFDWVTKKARQYNDINSDSVPIPKLIGDQGNDIEICKYTGPLIHYSVIDYLENQYRSAHFLL